jgi:ABC-2 type transport system permease protein
VTGFYTLFLKEWLRFWKVAVQTVLAPVLTAMLYLLVFAHTLRGHVEVFPGVDYAAFLIPGLVAGMHSDKVDELSVFTNFIILPLTFLAGVFYSIHSLPPPWQKVSYLNPIFYIIDGLRYGFFGRGDVAPWVSLGIVSVVFAGISLLALRLIKTGYKLRH